MTWLIEDRAGELHEVLEDERVLVLARDQECGRTWLREEGLPPFGRQFVVSPSPRALEGGRWPVVVELDCFRENPWFGLIYSAVDRSAEKMPTPPRLIQAICR